MFYSANGKFTKKSIKEGFLDVFHGYVHKHDKTELDKIKSDINDVKDKADDLSKEVKSSKRNFYGLYDILPKLDEFQDEINQKFSYLDEVQDEMEQQINEMNYFEGNVGIGTPPHNDYKLDVNGGINVNLKSGTEQQRKSKAINVFKNFNGVVNGNYVGNISGIDHNIGETGVRFLEKGGDDFRSNQTKVLNVLSNNDSKMVVTGSGNVGIGETNPENILHVRGNGPQLLLEGELNEKAIMRFSSGPSYGDKYHEIENEFYAIKGHATKNKMHFKVNNGGETNSPGKRMTIRGDGNVGIGTTSPSALLEIKKPLTNSGSFPAGNLKFSTTNGANNWDLGEIEGYVAAGTGGSADSYPGGLAFKTKNIGAHDKSLTTKMVLDAKGNVGVGTIAPSSTLDVNGSFKAKNILHPIRNHNGNFSSYWNLGGRRIFHWIAAVKGSSSYENICNIEIDYLVNFGRNKGNGTHNRFCRSVGKLTVNWIDYGPTGRNENQYNRHIWYKKTEKKFSPMAFLEFYILRKDHYVYIGVAMNGQRSENMAYWGNYDVKVLGDSIQETKIFTRDDEFCLYSHNEDHQFTDWDNTTTRFNANAIIDPKHLKPDSWRKENGSYIDRNKVDFSNSWETTNGYTWDDNKSLWDIFTDQEKKSPK